MLLMQIPLLNHLLQTFMRCFKAHLKFSAFYLSHKLSDVSLQIHQSKQLMHDTYDVFSLPQPIIAGLPVKTLKFPHLQHLELVCEGQQVAWLLIHFLVIQHCSSNTLSQDVPSPYSGMYLELNYYSLINVNSKFSWETVQTLSVCWRLLQAKQKASSPYLSMTRFQLLEHITSELTKWTNEQSQKSCFWWLMAFSS